VRISKRERGIDPQDTTQPALAAMSSAVSFVVGAIIPLVASLLPPRGDWIWVTMAAVLAALAVAGMISVRLGGAPLRRVVVRVLVGGARPAGVLCHRAGIRHRGWATGPFPVRAQIGPVERES
jgi:VIT1/CCC1 family predicted Fe2+/Mn2+ transporter